MDQLIKKTYNFEIKDIDEEKRSFIATASSEEEDRDGDIIRADAWKLKEFKKNPVIPLFHNYNRFPVAKAERIHIEDKKLVFKPIFATQEQNPEAETAWQLYKGGFMSAWSVGFIPKKWEEKERKSGVVGKNYTEVELLEISAVVVPSNPNALSEARSKGIDIDIISKEVSMSDLYEKDLTNSDIWDIEVKPYPNEHSCRLESPEKYIRIRRENDKFADGIHAIWGVQAGDKPVELQAIRFDKSKYSVSKAKSWLSDHDYKCKEFEPASEKCPICGIEMSWAQKITGEDDYQPKCDCSSMTSPDSIVVDPFLGSGTTIDILKREMAIEFAKLYIAVKEIKENVSSIKKGMEDMSEVVTSIREFIGVIEKKYESEIKDSSAMLNKAEEILNLLQ